MDLEVLIWLVILLAPVLSRLLRKKRKQNKSTLSPTRRPVTPPESTKARQLTPFEEALRQIQDALAEGRRSASEPDSRPEPEPRPAPPRLAPNPLQKQSDEFHIREPVATSPRFYDDAFDAEPPFTAPGADEHYHEPLGEERPAVAVTTRTRKHKKRTKWQKAVMNVVLLDKPRSRKPWSPLR